MRGLSRRLFFSFFFFFFSFLTTAKLFDFITRSQMSGMNPTTNPVHSYTFLRIVSSCIANIQVRLA